MMRAVTVVLVWAAIAGCARNPVSGMPEIMMVSVEQEKKIGAEEAKNVEEQMGLLDDAALTGYLDMLGQRLAKESPRQDVVYQFRVADQIEPNAFALPGGYIYVTRGLLALTNSEDELAGVVGHEIGHVAARHSVQKISKQGPFAVAFGIASGLTGLVSPLVGNIIGGIGDFTQSLIFSPYSRSQETQADRIGQEMAAQAGWDPAALSSFLATLEREVELVTKGPARHSFFDSHPATPDRVAKTREHAKELKQARREPISPSREAFLARLDGLVVGQRADNGIIQGSTLIHPDSNFQIQFPEKWQIANSPLKIVAAAPSGDVAIALSAAAEGSDPLDGARAVERASKVPIVQQTRTTTINGLPAAETQVDADGKVRMDLTWIAQGELIYQIAGIAHAKRFNDVRPLFVSTVRSFRPLTASERAGVKEKRIRLVPARAGETIGALAARTNSAWTENEIAVANGLAVEKPLQESRLLKVAIAELYESKKLP
ncbi:MAG TPA: M48 family metalloprotease [Nitrospira sp.]